MRYLQTERFLPQSLPTSTDSPRASWRRPLQWFATGCAFCVLATAGPLGSTVFAGEPPDAAANCSVTPADDLNGALLVPAGGPPQAAAVHEIIVRNGDNVPIPNAAVVVTLTAANPICPSTVLTGITDANGAVTIRLGGGGCVEGVPLSCTIKANGLTIRAYDNVKSPDANGDLRVDLQDLLSFSREFLGDGAECHDYDNNGETGLPELLIFGPAFTRGVDCN